MVINIDVTDKWFIKLVYYMKTIHYPFTYVYTSVFSFSLRFNVIIRNFSFVMSISKRVLTCEEKAAAIRKVENGLKTKSLIAKEFDIPLNTLSTYFKNEDNILSKLATLLSTCCLIFNKYSNIG